MSRDEATRCYPDSGLLGRETRLLTLSSAGVHKTVARVRHVRFLSSLALALDGCERSASSPGRLTPAESDPVFIDRPGAGWGPGCV